MGSKYGACEIVELEDDPKPSDFNKKNHQIRANDKGKKPQGCSKSIEDDINKLFESINVRSSFHGLTLHETGATTPRRNPSKRPMRMSTSSSSNYPEPVSLKQALRGLCISQASEMAAMKRSSKPPGSPALSDAGKPETAAMKRSLKLPGSPSQPAITAMKRSSEPPSSPAQPEIAAIKRPLKPPGSATLPHHSKPPSVKASEESTSSSSRKMHPDPPKIMSKNEYFLQPTIKNPTKKDNTTLRLNEILREPESDYKPNKPVNKATLKLRRKGKLKKLIVKKKPPSPPVAPTSVPNTSHLVCERCHCALKGAPDGSNRGSTLTGSGPTGSVKSEFTQSSNSSIGEYSSSTSISEDSNLSRCSINNKPHMSTDTKWQAINHMIKQNGFLNLRHFNLLKKLGCGDIGTVYLAELVGTSCLFAIKVMDNEFLERRKKMPRAHTEREILRILDHPFLPTLYAHFVSENLSCLVMEFCPGGDLHVLRQKQPGRYYHEQAARFYVAEVLLALEYLHMLGIVYRDLKPENILVREDGHIMLTDFDLSLRCSVNPTLLQSPSSGPMDPARMSGPCAGSNCIDPFCIKPTCQVSCFTPRIRPHKPKPVPQSYPQLIAEPTEARSNSFVGTHEYLAPEIIRGDGHGSAVDWWTLGVFLFELLYGKTPFKGSGNDETLANVVLQDLKFPDTPIVSFQARDLIKGLLVKSPENRLGSERGAAEIRRHSFFEGLNWALIRCAIPPEVPESSEGKKFLDCSGGGGGHLEFELF